MLGLYLKALELQGFKSFPEKTVITFGEAITAIVGPNGSGKSNLSDAIRWVMGEQSTRALRGGKMEDVIFGGTQRRRQLGFAEVSLVLDNTAGVLPMEESEVVVTRRYFRSGESEYYINRRSVRLRDVNELFMDTGLGREGYSIIGQGRIDEILSVKSADRREIFEEAAGISRFRHRKEEAERSLERTQENLVRIGDKIDELELQVEPLRGQAEKAQKYLILRDELRLLEISLWMEQLDRLRAGSVKLNTDYDAAVRQKEEAQRAVEALYAAAEAYAAQMRDKDVQAEGIRFAMMQRQADANTLENEAAVLKADIRNNLANRDRLQQELDQQEGRSDSLSTQIAQRQTRLADINRELEALEQARQDRERAAREAEQAHQAVLDELEALRGRAAEETASAAEAKALLSALAAAAQEMMDRDEAVRQELSAGEDRLREEEQARAQTARALEEAREGRESLKNTISGYTLRLEQRRSKGRQAEDRLVKLRMEENALSARIHMLTEMEKVYEGYSKAVKVVMGEAERNRLWGIHGPVAGLIHVPDPYAVAIEIALGGAMQHIVVDDEAAGKAAIQCLKRRDGGRGTFLPLSVIRPSDFRDKGVAGQPGFVGMADALVSSAPAYRNVLSNLLGRVVIAEDMDAAIAMAGKFGHRFKIVTLDGQVLNPGGSMTGGSASRSAGILSRANELERLNAQAGGVRDDLAAAAQASEAAKRETEAAAYQLETAQGELRTHEDQVLKLEGRLSGLDAQLQDLQARQDLLREELAQLAARSEQTEAETVRARAQIARLEGTAEALRAETESRAAARSDAQARLAELNAAIAQDSARLAALEAERQAQEKAVDELETLRRDIAGDRDERVRRLDALEEKNRQLEGQILDKEQALRAIQEENRSREAEIARINQEKLALEAKRTQADKVSRDRNSALLSMEREVSVLEQRRAAAALEEKQILDKLWEIYELSHEAARAQRTELESPQKAARRIAELKRSISALGNINLDAIEEFQRVNERYTYLTGQRDDVSRSKGELEGIIAGITAEMKRIFAQQFAVINQAFGETFAELFGGGRAALELEDPEDILNCGIEIRVQPPGKALKVLSLLSGGEKAFVAIALYFAILKVRPTPFCVMDEIEAALDDANIERFARYLRQMCQKTQFIVITHRRGTMEEADVLYGVTMQEQGVSRLLTINLNEAEKELNLK